MKIAMIGSKGMPAIHGGVERHVHDLSVRLVERGHHVTVYSRTWYAQQEKELHEGVQLFFTPSIYTKHLDAITHTFTSTIHAIWNRYDIIHYHGVGPSLLSWIPRIFAPKTRVINTFHSIDRKHEKWGFIARTVLRLGERASATFSHKTIAVSRTIQQYVRDAYSKDVDYIPNGVPTFVKTKEKKSLRQFNLKPKQYIVMVSRLIPHKGAHYLIAAYQQLQKKYPELMADKKLVIVGGAHHTDDYVSYLHNMREGDQNIIFTGFQSGDVLKEILSHAALMVHPSMNEGLPITVLEGMSYGLPILLSDIPEHLELINSDLYNFKRGDAVSLAKKLKTLLETPAADRANQGKKNKTIINKGFHWDTIVPEIENLYFNALHEKKRDLLQLALD